ncbi:MAG TPA: OsmC family protein [Thermoleophilia bacterium]|nr:OsmC family protein [Thermoleophilia bacterium]
MHVEVGFPEKGRIQARTKDLLVEVGLPPDRGGDPEGLGPFDILLCSLATCTGFHVMSFLDERGLPLDDAGVTIDAMRSEESHLLESVTVKIKVPEGFPEKYRDAIVRSANLCLVKAQLGQKPEFVISVASA